MEALVTLGIPAFLTAALVRALLLPLHRAARLALHSCCGFACLWLLNAASGITGILFPVNAVTVLIAGTLGLPGIGLMALLAVMG